MARIPGLASWYLFCPLNGVRSEQTSRSFDLRAAAWYRSASDARWRIGITRRVSTTGAVIQSEHPPSLSDPILIVIALSDSGCLVGHGRVVRAQPSDDLDVPADFAIAVDHYNLEHRESILIGPRPVLHRC